MTCREDTKGVEVTTVRSSDWSTWRSYLRV